VAHHCGDFSVDEALVGGRGYEFPFMAGLGPAIYASRERVVKVVPDWIAHQDQPDLPCARVVLQVPFSLARLSNVIIALCINEAL